MHVIIRVAFIRTYMIIHPVSVNFAKPSRTKGLGSILAAREGPSGSLPMVKDHTQTGGCQLSTEEETIEAMWDPHKETESNMNLDAVVVNLASRKQGKSWELRWWSQINILKQMECIKYVRLACVQIHFLNLGNAKTFQRGNLLELVYTLSEFKVFSTI